MKKELWKKKKVPFKKQAPFYVMMAPGLFMIALLFYAPMVGIILAFKDFNPVDGISKSPWMDPWYKNFEFFFKSDTVKTVPSIPYFITCWSWCL